MSDAITILLTPTSDRYLLVDATIVVTHDKVLFITFTEIGGSEIPFVVLVSRHQTKGFPSLQTNACSKTLEIVARPKASEMVATDDILDFITRISLPSWLSFLVPGRKLSNLLVVVQRFSQRSLRFLVRR